MIKKLFYLALGLMSSSGALAAGSQDEITWDAIENQIHNSGSVTLLAKLYGSWVLNLFGTTTMGGPDAVVVTPVTVFASLIGVAGWSLFMILAGYVGIVGLVRTAQHGEFLGRDWDSTWVLARMLGALILSAPLASTGTSSSNLAAGQTLVIRAAIVSSAAADIVWGKTLNAIGNERINQDQTLKVDTLFTMEQASELVRKGVNHGVCYKTSLNNELASNPNMTGEQHQAINDRIINHCQMDYSLFRRGQGTVEVVDDFSRGATQRRGDDMMLGSVDTWYRPEEIHRAKTIQDATRNIAKDYYLKGFQIGSDIPEMSSGIERAQRSEALARELKSTMSSSVERILQEGYRNSAVLFGQDAQRYGWVSAGNYYRVLATQQTSINAALTEAVSIGGPGINPEELTSGLPNDDLVYYNVNHAVTRGEQFANSGAGQVVGTVGDAVGTGAGAIGHMFGQGLESIGMNPLAAGDTSDPLVVSANVGHALSTVAQWGGIASKTPFAKTVLGSDTAKMVLAILLVVGVFLGDIIPSLPWVYFLFGTIAWLVHVTEMFVSAPLWVAAHAAPEGNSHTSNLAAKGYNNMLYVMLYPILAIGGFIAAMAINWIGMYMLNQMIGEQFSNQMGGVLGFLAHGLPTLLGFALLYLGCTWIIVNTSFNLINAFPKTILNWLSTSEPGHNAYDQGGHQVLGIVGNLQHKFKGVTAIGTKLLTSGADKPSKGAGKVDGTPKL